MDERPQGSRLLQLAVSAGQDPTRVMGTHFFSLANVPWRELGHNILWREFDGAILSTDGPTMRLVGDCLNLCIKSAPCTYDTAPFVICAIESWQ